MNHNCEVLDRQRAGFLNATAGGGAIGKFFEIQTML
jgi:hypothetical protein